MKRSSNWKKVELEYCRRLGGGRRGANYRNIESGSGNSDCVGCRNLSVEVKVHQRPTFSIMQDDARKAIARKENQNDIGIAIMKKKGDLYDDGLVVILWSEFEQRILPLILNGEAQNVLSK